MSKYPWLGALGFDFLLIYVVPWVIKHVTEQGQTHLKNKEDRRELKVVFAQALGDLAAGSAGDVAVFECIVDFQSAKMGGDPTDLEDFQAHTAQIGGSEVDKTMNFLRALAKLPDHDARMVLLDDLGFIGSRAVDWREWVITKGHDFLKIAFRDWRIALVFFQTQGGRVVSAAQKVGQVVDDVASALEAEITAPRATPGGTTTLLGRSARYRKGAFTDLGAAWKNRNS
jgi:hypothetical protein